MRVSGSVRVPGDKSISHRALICAALSDGVGRITGVLDAADVRSTAGALRALGVEVPELSPDFAVTGRGLRGLRAASAAIDCGNSGTTTRLLAGVAAAHPFGTTFHGDASLTSRPMLRVAEPLRALGASVELSDAGTLPMRVEGGALRSTGEWRSPVASAQVKSAVLFAGLCAGIEVVVREPQRSRDHTERMLASRGVEVWVNEDAVLLFPTESMRAADVSVPGDPSSAAYFAAVAALAEGGELVLPDVSVNEGRVGFLDALERMGATVRYANTRGEGGEPVADLLAAPGPLRAISIGAAQVPAMIDELPLLACVAARAEGETRVTGAAELRVKESDRIRAVVENLRAVGVTAEELPDGFVVVGSARPLAGRVRTYGDHRLAMAFGVLGAATGGQIEIDDPACVSVSYPSFWDDLRQAAR
jgi:3-phosphoshikimate 1-carboxyvinyltransferase